MSRDGIEAVLCRLESLATFHTQDTKYGRALKNDLDYVREFKCAVDTPLPEFEETHTHRMNVDELQKKLQLVLTINESLTRVLNNALNSI